VQHRPLARALQEASARGDRQALLHLLVPLQRARRAEPWLAELVDSGAVYQWTTTTGTIRAAVEIQQSTARKASYCDNAIFVAFCVP
jgi:hypothetical protein